MSASARLKLHEAYRAVFGGAPGEIVLEDLLRVAQVNVTTFAPGDPHRTSFNEGKRIVGLHILHSLGRAAQDVPASEPKGANDAES